MCSGGRSNNRGTLFHYLVHEKTSGADGQGLLPGIIMRYPDRRSIVIDSKVSLLHCGQHCSAEQKDQQDMALRLLLHSLTRHTDGLPANNTRKRWRARQQQLARAGARREDGEDLLEVGDVHRRL